MVRVAFLPYLPCFLRKKRSFGIVFFNCIFSERNPTVWCSFLINVILTHTIAMMCTFSKTCTLLALYNHLSISARVLCIQNMLIWECLIPRSYVKHRMRRSHSIDLSRDRAPKSSCVEQDETNMARCMRPLSYPHWYFSAFAGDRPAIDDGVQGTCQLRSLTPWLLQNQKTLAEPRPVAM